MTPVHGAAGLPDPVRPQARQAGGDLRRRRRQRADEARGRDRRAQRPGTRCACRPRRGAGIEAGPGRRRDPRRRRAQHRHGRRRDAAGLLAGGPSRSALASRRRSRPPPQPPPPPESPPPPLSELAVARDVRRPRAGARGGAVRASTSPSAAPAAPRRSACHERERDTATTTAIMMRGDHAAQGSSYPDRSCVADDGSTLRPWSAPSRRSSSRRPCGRRARGSRAR